MTDRRGLKAIQHLVGAWAELSTLREDDPLAIQTLGMIRAVVRQVATNTDSKSWILCSKLLEHYQIENPQQLPGAYFSFFNTKDILSKKTQSIFNIISLLPPNVMPQGFRDIPENQTILGGTEQRLTVENFDLLGGSVRIDFTRSVYSQNKVVAHIVCSNIKNVEDEDVSTFIQFLNLYLN